MCKSEHPKNNLIFNFILFPLSDVILNTTKKLLSHRKCPLHKTWQAALSIVGFIFVYDAPHVDLTSFLVTLTSFVTCADTWTGFLSVRISSLKIHRIQYNLCQNPRIRSMNINDIKYLRILSQFYSPCTKHDCHFFIKIQYLQCFDSTFRRC